MSASAGAAEKAVTDPPAQEQPMQEQQSEVPETQMLFGSGAEAAAQASAPGAAAAACAAEVVEVPEKILCFTESGGGQRREAAGEQCAALHER